MLLAGDEVLRTQRGNNNAWCQDNEISWFDWRLTETNSDMLRFVREMIALRRRHPGLSRTHFLTGETDPARGIPDIRWYDAGLGTARWDDPETRFLSFTLAGTTASEEHLHVLINMSDRVERVDLPRRSGRLLACCGGHRDGITRRHHHAGGTDSLDTAAVPVSSHAAWWSSSYVRADRDAACSPSAPACCRTVRSGQVKASRLSGR